MPKTNGDDTKKKKNSPPVDSSTCEHGRTEELKNGGRVCLNCGEKLLDKDTQQLADAIAGAVVRAMKRGTVENKPPKKKPLTLRQKLGLDAEEGEEEEGEEGEEAQED